MNPRSSTYIAIVIGLGAACLAHGFWTFAVADPGTYLAYLLLALAASGVKIRLPGVPGTLSPAFFFVLLGISAFSLAETLLMGCLGALIQSFYGARRRPGPMQVSFNVAVTAFSIDISYTVQNTSHLHSGLLTAATLFAASTIPVSIVIALTERKNAWNVWRACFCWTFPNYLAGAGAVWVIKEAEHMVGWRAGFLLLPMVYFVYRSHRAWLDGMAEADRRAAAQAIHAVEMAAVHRRTIEMLALAVEAKDPTTRDHLQRVETYAVEIGKELGIEGKELDALRAAALLHDIGKLAVPEYIIAKPGKLTQEEFERMKTHTVVGCEIVERIGFPYDVAPLVRGHHERWDGTGYPDGLAGSQIPLGARILAAVDCLDALASDRQYRRAMPLSEAIQYVHNQAGTSFDPGVVEILGRRYIEIADMVKQREIARLPTSPLVERGNAPAAGFEKIAEAETEVSEDTASRDLCTLQHKLENDAGNASALSELVRRLALCGSRETVFATLRTSLRPIVPYDAMVMYLRRGDGLSPVCLDSGELEPFGLPEIHVGEGLSGWVAENCKAIVNGNPQVEPESWTVQCRFADMHSAMAVPAVTPNGLLGVLSLYRKDPDSFTGANLAALTAVSGALAQALESAPASNLLDPNNAAGHLVRRN